MLKKVSNFLVKVVEKYMPDPYIFAAILTFVVYIAALIFTDSKPLGLIDAWSKGLWGLLVFTMQISIALVFSTAIIRTEPVDKMLKKVCKTARTPVRAYFLASFIAGIFSLLSWAAGLVVGAIMAKELAKNVKGCHYPLLVASGYSGFLIWHMGYTSSTALSIATPGHFLEGMIGIIPTSQTIFAPFNIITALALLILTPLLMSRLAPEKKEDIKEVDPAIFGDDELAATVVLDRSKMTFADKLENARIINLVLGIGAAIFMVRFFAKDGGLTMDSTNMSFLTIALLLNKTPRQFIDNCVEGGKSLGPIVMQFPLYGGIMGLMIDSGLATIISNAFVSISTVKTLPLFSLLSAGFINFFVPSGGSQWAVQGPIMMEAAKTMGADPARVAMAVAWGDQWTNMIQPFWALPLLAIANMKAKDIMGYCILALILGGIAFGLGITFIP
ncbi:TIGR00366 family protein [Proteiniborus sp. MB09-C3]|uniref:short-chain fatty acid transporter n=1 Tax=Proteiniborus sp. MB09-C3 TaxID=3050072 RepID=UPI0025573114|nr:TIGR00366 family protein [Proteiniborus sp. MB09-C3]WIV11435.1 TIGR00366 family protein [Proteiniborus sp. MB09-C3]